VVINAAFENRLSAFDDSDFVVPGQRGDTLPLVYRLCTRFLLAVYHRRLKRVYSAMLSDRSVVPNPEPTVNKGIWGYAIPKRSQAPAQRERDIVQRG
jgi:hypothetical protein